jgi:hypothetical protein
LPRNDLNNPSARWPRHAAVTRVLAIHLLGFCGLVFSGYQLFAWCKKSWRLAFLPALLYKQTGRCEVTTAFIAICTVLLPKFLTIVEA